MFIRIFNTLINLDTVQKIETKEHTNGNSKFPYEIKTRHNHGGDTLITDSYSFDNRKERDTKFEEIMNKIDSALVKSF